ncbi:MAG: hypothetical protein ACTIJ9_09080 [Aequorivita sp.]
MNNKNLTTFFLKLVFFGLITVLVIGSFILPYAPDLGEEDNLAVTAQKISKQEADYYDMLFFTNSYLYTSLDPIIIKERLGLDALHLTSGSQRLETSLTMAHEVIKTHTPSYVVFDVSAPTIPNPEIEDEKYWYFQTVALQEIPFSLDKGINVTKYFPIKEYTEKYVSAVSKKAGRVFRMNDLENYAKREPSYKTSNKNVYYTFNGFIATNAHKTVEEKIFEESFYKELEPSKNVDNLWGESLIALMNRFLDETSKRGIEVIFVHSLKMKPTGYTSKILDGWVEKYPNVKFLDFNLNRDKYSLSGKDFFDNSHLNYTANIQVTSSFVDSLSTWYSLPKIENTELDFKYFKFKSFFYNLNEQEDKFIKLEFEDEFPLELKNHKLVISLYPEDTTLLSDYSKKLKFRSDNFYIEMDKAETIDNGDSKIIIQRLDSRINQNTLEDLKLYFYRPNDTLDLPVYNLNEM